MLTSFNLYDIMLVKRKEQEHMASKGTYTAPPEHWKHLKWTKRVFNKAERVAAKKDIEAEVKNIGMVDEVGLGLHKPKSTMMKLRHEKGDSIIPKGPYCMNCDYLDCATNKEEQSNGFCWFLLRGDWDLGACSLLWDGCKECGFNDGEEFDECN